MTNNQTMTGVISGRVLKTASNLFSIDINGEVFECTARKTIKAVKGSTTDKAIVTGDIVNLEKEENGFVISQVLPRKNFIIRPLVANIDQIIVILAPIPKPDFYLIDKLIINASLQNIDVILCLNKTDISDELVNELNLQYITAVSKIICISAKKNDIAPLKEILKNKLSCFCGQSAVGKSTILNSLLGIEKQKTNDVSQKIQRGKNTTTRAEIVKIKDDSYIIDTPGFSMLDIHGLDIYDLDLVYSEYVEVSNKCKYHRCSHTVEPNCFVKELVSLDKLNKDRYNRYCEIHNELKHKRKEY